MCFLDGSALLSISIAFNAITVHATCTQAFVVIAMVLVFCLASIQTLDKVFYIGWIGLTSIMSAILVLAVAVGVQDRPAAAPATGPWSKDFHLFGDPSFVTAANALGTLIFSYGSTPSYFNIISEMRNPRDFTKAAVACQSTITAVYFTLAIVVYYFCGQYVASPALGSAGPFLKRICYGLALPGLCISGLLFTHLPAKYVFVRVLRGSDHLSANTVTHWAAWLGSVAACAVFSYIVASAIPFFDDLISLVGALFGTPIVVQLEASMWLYLDCDKLRARARRTTQWYGRGS